MTAPAYNWTYQQARARLLASRPLCVHGCGHEATEADHQPPLSLHAHVAGTGCCTLVPSCARHARAQGARLAGVTARVARPSIPPAAQAEAPPRELDAAGYTADDPVWDRAPWLEHLRDVPPDATWPRLMTPPHPDAVDSYGAALTAHAAVRGWRLRWWQQLAAARLGEHDAAGRLCWKDVGLTVARQLGKSRLLSEVAMWRLDDGDHLWHEPQLILHTGKDLAICVEVQRHDRRWARMPERAGVYKVRESHGQEEIERLGDGSRWMVRAKESAFGLSASEAFVDEAWAVDPEVIEEGVVPTMVAQTSRQLLLVSTAHRKATGLMVNRRNSVVGDVADTGGVLWMEWSASPLLDDGDELAWRQASPHWDDDRGDMIARRLATALAGEATNDPDEGDPLEAFRCQWLNRWPRHRRRAGHGEPLLPDGVWAACAGALDDTVPGGVVALEENNMAAGGAAAAVCASDGAGRFELDGVACDTWDEAIAKARWFMEARPGARLLVGIAMRNQLPADFPGRASAQRAGANIETKRGLSVLRALAGQGRVVHDATVQLDDQIARNRVHPLATGGLGLVNNGQRRDLLNAALWALDAAQAPAPRPAVH